MNGFEGFNARTGAPVFVPLNFVACPYRPRPGLKGYFYSSSNGLAAGNTLEEAVCQALCEVIERDAVSVAGASLHLGPRVRAALSTMGRTPDVVQSYGHFPQIARDGLPRRAANLVRRLENRSFDVFLRNCMVIPGIPVIECLLVSSRPGGGYSAYAGHGAHPDAEIALLRAITEATQSRVTHIQGGREDLTLLDRHAVKSRYIDPEAIFGTSERISYSALPSRSHDRLEDDLGYLLTCLCRAGLDLIAVVDMTHPRIGVPVVRVIVPKRRPGPCSVCI